LPANWTLRRSDSGKIVDHIGSIPAHSFNDTYLSPYYDIRPEVVKGIKQELSQLKNPPQVVKSGSVTVTLTWNIGNGNDLDLYVFEPDKTPVYFGSQTGNSGYLDVDSRQGFGPEHYYTDCEKLQVGEYLVGVKYFSDSSKPARQVTATVTISTPGSTRTFITKLGNANPTSPNLVKLAKVVIGRISHPTSIGRRLKYQIIPMLAPEEKMLPIGANDYQAWFDRGQKFVELGRFEEGIESYDKALQIKPDSVAWNNRGSILYKLGRYQEAMESHDKALQIQANDHVAWNDRGNALYGLGRYQEALENYDKSLQIKPDYVVWSNRGNVLGHLGRYQEAIEGYDKALQIKPDYYLTWNNRGNALNKLGRYQEAIESYDKSLQIKPDYKFAKDGRQNALEKLKQQ
jgi:Tfp pilus assembly protein PilF